MAEVLSAFTKAGRDLLRPGILWQAVWPPLVALFGWSVVAVMFWAGGVALMAQAIPEIPWQGWAWISHWAAAFLFLATIASLVYATSLLLVAVFALPRLLAIVAVRDYPELSRQGESPFWLSLGNTLAAGAVFLLGWVLTLPLLLVPGMVLVLPLAWTAWLNQRTFRVDALAEHAGCEELRALVASSRPSFYLAGVGTALMAHVPVVNLLSPAYTALVFVHLGLGALRRRRLAEGVTVETTP